MRNDAQQQPVTSAPEGEEKTYAVSGMRSTRMGVVYSVNHGEALIVLPHDCCLPQIYDGDLNVMAGDVRPYMHALIEFAYTPRQY